jgi:hypothetical protein
LAWGAGQSKLTAQHNGRTHARVSTIMCVSNTRCGGPVLRNPTGRIPSPQLFRAASDPNHITARRRIARGARDGLNRRKGGGVVARSPTSKRIGWGEQRQSVTRPAIRFKTAVRAFVKIFRCVESGRKVTALNGSSDRPDAPALMPQEKHRLSPRALAARTSIPPRERSAP